MNGRNKTGGKKINKNWTRNKVYLNTICPTRHILNRFWTKPLDMVIIIGHVRLLQIQIFVLLIMIVLS